MFNFSFSFWILSGDLKRIEKFSVFRKFDWYSSPKRLPNWESTNVERRFDLFEVETESSWFVFSSRIKRWGEMIIFPFSSSSLVYNDDHLGQYSSNVSLKNLAKKIQLLTNVRLWFRYRLTKTNLRHWNWNPRERRDYFWIIHHHEYEMYVIQFV